MKKIILLLSIPFLLTNCTKEDVDTINALSNPEYPDSRITMKLNGNGYHENVNYYPPNNAIEHTMEWGKTEKAVGKFSYSVFGDVESDVLSFGVGLGIYMELGENIKNGQIINATSSELTLEIFDLGMSNLRYRLVKGLTTGQIKITSFDGKKMSGTFNFNSLERSQNDKITTDNTLVGTFTLIEKQN